MENEESNNNPDQPEIVSEPASAPGPDAESAPTTASTPEYVPPVVSVNPSVTPAPNAPTTAVQTSNGLAIAAMVVGIIALVLSWVPFVGIALGITAVVLGIIALKKANSKGMSIAGIVTGGLAILTGLVVSFLIIFSIALFGNAVSQAGKATNDLNKEQQTLVGAKKDFTKGQTAVFGNFEVKANSIQRDYVPTDEFSQASEGKELVVVNVSVKNIATSSKSFISYDLQLNVNGVAVNPSYLVVSPEFTGGSISAGATATGNIVFEITKGATNLKLQHEESAYDSKSSEFTTLTYTLEI
jgi:hypothetical protein